MKKGTLLLLFVLCLNLASYGLSYSCTEGGANCGEKFKENSVINFFFDVNDQTDLNATTGLKLDDDFESELASSTKEKTGIASQLINGAIGFLDSMRMVLGFITLLTPLPIITVLTALGIPLLFMMLLIIPIIAMYSIGIIEFIRGGEF